MVFPKLMPSVQRRLESANPPPTAGSRIFALAGPPAAGFSDIEDLDCPWASILEAPESFP